MGTINIMRNIGDRVGCILSGERDGKTVNFLGYGVYEGDFISPIGPFGMSWEEFDEIARKDDPNYTADKRAKNPRIKLDNGNIVWGQECWWGDEEKIKKMLDGKTVVIVDIDGKPLILSQNG